MKNEKKSTPKWAKWGVDFFLYYGHGHFECTRFYRTKLGARISIFRKKYITSDGGTANLFPIIMKTSKSPKVKT